MAPPPVVTGLSPNEGPPGTKITIRGENFGSTPSDLIGNLSEIHDMQGTVNLKFAFLRTDNMRMRLFIVGGVEILKEDNSEVRSWKRKGGCHHHNSKRGRRDLQCQF